MEYSGDPRFLPQPFVLDRLMHNIDNAIHSLPCFHFQIVVNYT
jgi:hypothetical protein